MGNLHELDYWRFNMNKPIPVEERYRNDGSGKWFKGNMHMHTNRSDGSLSVVEAAAYYAERGYDFIAITDHRSPFITAEFHEKLPIIVLDGIELDGQDDDGSFYHVLCIGGVSGITKDMPLMQAVQKAKSEGSFLIWAHPPWSGNSVVEGMRHGFHGVEVYNHTTEMTIGKGLGAFHWDSVLEQKRDMVGLATDDNHFVQGAPPQVGGWIMVNATELSPEAIMASIRSGNFYSSTGPEFKSLYVEQGDRVVAETSPIVHARLIGPITHWKWRATTDNRTMTQFHFRIPEEWPFARLEIEDVAGKKAWSNALPRSRG
jgi:hypothetical protein